MADYDLCYFVEGTEAFGLVTIPGEKIVLALAGEIRNQLNNTYWHGIGPWN